MLFLAIVTLIVTAELFVINIKRKDIIMKKSLILLGLLILSTQYVHADQYVNGY